jgi:hypothetical protein
MRLPVIVAVRDGLEDATRTLRLAIELGERVFDDLRARVAAVLLEAPRRRRINAP